MTVIVSLAQRSFPEDAILDVGFPSKRNMLLLIFDLCKPREWVKGYLISTDISLIASNLNGFLFFLLITHFLLFVHFYPSFCFFSIDSSL